MTTLTLESIKTEQNKLAQMIDNFQKQSEGTHGHRFFEIKLGFHFPGALIELRHGEHYAGIITGKDGEASYHLILLPDSPTDDLNWTAAKDWAKRVGGDLPTRREQSLLFANCKEQFEQRYHWSNEQYASDSSYAWSQHFYDGFQDLTHVSGELRARAVRRLPI